MSAVPVVELGGVTTKVGSGATPRGGEAAYKPSGIPLIRSMNVHFDGFRRDGLAFLDEEQARALKNVEVRAGDVLLNITGASIGRVTVAPTAMDGARVNQHVCIIRPDQHLDSSFLRWYLAAPSQQRLINGIESGATRQALTKEKILGFEVPLFPLSRQREIVAEIEKQLSRLDDAVANLKRVKANLKRYRASVLADAVEGDLAGDRAEWRNVHLGDIAISVRNGISIKPVGESGTRILRISAVRPMTLDLDDVRYLGQPLDNFDSFRLAAGDVVFTRYNGSVDLVGVCAAVPELLEPTVYPDKLIRIRVPSDVLLPAFLVIAASTGEGRAFIGSRIRTTAGQAGVSGADIKGIPLRVPPLAVQRRIVAEVDRHLSIIREVEAEVDANLKRAQALRQAVLARAIRG